MHLLLIRHGRSAHVHRGGLLGRDDVEGWRQAYDAAGVAHDSAPPAALMEEVARAHVLAASDLPRALASAERLAPGRSVDVSPLLREIPIRIPMWSLRAPLPVWGALIHLRWALDIVRGTDQPPQALDQARGAAEWCRLACRQSVPEGTVAVITHGVFRRLLARELTGAGWQAEPGRRSYACWSVWRLRAPDDISG